MKVFNVHKVLHSILSERIVMHFEDISNRVVNYGEGDLKELNKVLTHKQEKYPILWLSSDFTTPTPLKKSVTRIDIDLTFFVIVDGSKTDYYRKRYAEKYEDIIYPVIEAFQEVITETKGVQILLDDDYLNISDYPYNNTNSFDSPKSETMTINDIWDATKFTTKLRFTPECFKEQNKCNSNNKKYKIIWDSQTEVV